MPVAKMGDVALVIRSADDAPHDRARARHPNAGRPQQFACRHEKLSVLRVIPWSQSPATGTGSNGASDDTTGFRP